MKFYGDVAFQQNTNTPSYLKNAAFENTQNFPTTPVVGEIAFIGRIVYICVQNTPSPAIWVPLTNEITAYTHSQTSASTTWSVSHGLNTTSVNIQIFDGNSNVIIPDSIVTTGPNTCTITFSTAQAGRAVVVTGHFDGNVKPTYAYTFYQTTASTSWDIVHNLGYEPIVRVFIGTNEVQPYSINHVSTNEVVITFTTALAGTARLI
jgi:hypothetical protein